MSTHQFCIEKASELSMRWTKIARRYKVISSRQTVSIDISVSPQDLVPDKKKAYVPGFILSRPANISAKRWAVIISWFRRGSIVKKFELFYLVENFFSALRTSNNGTVISSWLLDSGPQGEAVNIINKVLLRRSPSIMGKHKSLFLLVSGTSAQLWILRKRRRVQ